MSVSEMLPEAEIAYGRFRSGCLQALAKLAREGFLSDPQDGISDVWEFFHGEEYDGLRSRYDAKRGDPAGYVCSSFTYFVRNRIIRQQRWPIRLYDLASVADQAKCQQSGTQLGAIVGKEEIEVLHGRLARLPPQHRELLLEFFAKGPRSQRELCRKYKLTRYRLRATLIEALGELVVSFGEHEGWPSGDWDVARALWHEGRTVEETAALLQSPLAAVQEARKRLVQRFARILSGRTADPKSAPRLTAPSPAEQL